MLLFYRLSPFTLIRISKDYFLPCLSNISQILVVATDKQTRMTDYCTLRARVRALRATSYPRGYLTES